MQLFNKLTFKLSLNRFESSLIFASIARFSSFSCCCSSLSFFNDSLWNEIAFIPSFRSTLRQSHQLNGFYFLFAGFLSPFLQWTSAWNFSFKWKLFNGIFMILSLTVCMFTAHLLLLNRFTHTHTLSIFCIHWHLTFDFFQSLPHSYV